MAAAHAVTVGVNVEIAGDASPDRQRVEPSIAVDPRNPRIIVAASQDLQLLASGNHRWIAVFRSIDAGQTWSSNLLPGFPGDNSTQGLSSPLHGSRALSDSVVAFDRAGNLYLTGITTSVKLFVAKYINDGADYSFTTLICSFCADKPWIAVDTSGGANDGNVYVSYDGSGGINFVRSVDGGQTYSPAVLALRNDLLSGVTVDTRGTVYVSGLRTSVNPNHAIIEVAASTDAGQTFTGHEAAANMVPIPKLGNSQTSGPFPGNQFRVATIPQIAADSAGVYVVWDDYLLNNSNVLFVKSTDNGATWTTPIMINDALTGQHFFSTVAVSGGRISVAWYDSRLGQLSNGTITGLDLFYAFSNNGGASFSANLRLTSSSFSPNLVERSDFNDQSPFIGDYIQIASTATFAQAVWADNRNACDVIVAIFGCVDQDIFTATVTY